MPLAIEVLQSTGGGGGEPALGNPGTNGYVLTSTTAGVRSWVAPAGLGYTAAHAGANSDITSLLGLTTTAATPAVVIPSGVPLTTATDGTIEYNASLAHLNFTIGTTRFQVDNQTSVRTLDPGVMRQSSTFAQTVCATAVFLQQAVTVKTLSCWLFALNAAHPTLELGIYNAAGTKLGSATGVPAAVGIFTVTLATPITLTAGTLYYFAFLNRTAADVTTAIGSAYGFTTDTTLSYTIATQTTMPASGGTLASSSNNNWWIAGGT